MYCNKCGKELSEREKFCTFCGAEIDKAPVKSFQKDGSVTPAKKESPPSQLMDKTQEPGKAGRRRFWKRADIALAAILVLAVGVFLYANTKNQENKQNKTEPNNDYLSELVGQVDTADFNPDNLSDAYLSDNDAEAIAESVERGFFTFGNEFVFSNEGFYHDNNGLFFHALNYFWSQNSDGNTDSGSVCAKINSSASDSNYQWEAQAVDGFLRDEYGIEIDHSFNKETFGGCFTYQDGYYFGQMEGVGGAANYSVAKIVESKELPENLLYVSFTLETCVFEAEKGPEEFSVGGTFAGNAILQKNDGSTMFSYRLLRLFVEDDAMLPAQTTPVADTEEPQEDMEILIQSIRDRYSKIQSSIDTCEVVHFGTSADAYYTDGKLVLLREFPEENCGADYYDDYDERWYYDNGEVFFIFLTDPNNNDEYRLYFSNGELIRWIDPDGNVYDSDYRWTEMQSFYGHAKEQCDTYAIKGE